MRCINDVQYWHLPLHSQSQVRQLVSNLNQVLQHMNAKEEIYTVGNYSRIVGSELEALNLARLRRKVIISNLYCFYSRFSLGIFL